MSPTTTQPTLARIEAAIVTIVREATLPSTQERVTAQAGLAIERSGYIVLRAVDESGPLPVTTLARSLGLDASTVSRQVATLVRMGLLDRSHDADDKRITLVALTELGREALERIRSARHGVFAEVLDGWSDEDQATLAPLLERFAADLVAFGGRS
jgi:DNA-binding MarR family transcriptional regulator